MLHFVTPYSFEQRLFRAYDQEFNRLKSDSDWLCMTDGDVAFLNADFGHHIQEYIDAYPGTGLFTCYASRCHYKYMIPNDGNENSTDILFHRKIAIRHAKDLHLAVKPIEKNVAGHVMVMRKSTWLEIRGIVYERAKHETIEAIDTAISKALHQLNHSILLMRGIYVFHYCRMLEGYKHRSHLGYNNFINIVTPSCRPENLFALAESINIPKRMYRWIVVIDGEKPEVLPKFPANAEVYYHKNTSSKSGNSQRNYALSLIMSGNGNQFEEYIYFLDDDTVMHPDLYESVKDLNNDFIHFNQVQPDGSFRIGGQVKLNKVDSGNCLVKKSLVGTSRWRLDLYNADGVFLESVFRKATTPIYLDKALSIYNALRP